MWHLEITFKMFKKAQVLKNTIPITALQDLKIYYNAIGIM